MFKNFLLFLILFVAATHRLSAAADSLQNYPLWQTMIIVDETHICGGAVVKPEWILTSGQCLYGHFSWTVIVGTEHPFKKDNDPYTEKIIYTSEISLLHEKYKDDPFAYNIGLVKIPTGVLPEAAVKPIAWAQKDNVEIGTEAQICGWSDAQEDTEFYGGSALGCSNLVTVDPNFCQTNPEHNTDFTICAKAEDDYDYFGELGGPLIVEQGSGFVHIGIYSYRGDCQGKEEKGKKVYSFVKIFKFKDWYTRKTYTD